MKTHHHAIAIGSAIGGAVVAIIANVIIVSVQGEANKQLTTLQRQLTAQSARLDRVEERLNMVPEVPGAKESNAF